MKSEIQAAEIWRRYEQGLNYGRISGRFENSEKCWRFFEGDQWNGIKNADGALPFYNIIRPVVNYKKAKIAMNSKAIHFSADSEDEKGLLDAVNEKVRAAWEFGRMDDICWNAVECAMVEGDAYLYFPDGAFFGQEERLCRCTDRRTFVQVLAGTRVFLGDEEEPELQNQPYIILEERRLTETVCREAREAGIPEAEIRLIQPDQRSPAEVTTGTQTEQADAGSTGGRVTSLLYLERTAEGIRFCRAVQHCIYQPFQTIPGLQYYPLINYTVCRQKGKARGIGEVLRMIPNQIEINRTLVRRSRAIKISSFPKLVVNSDYLVNAESLDTVGATIELSGGQTLNNIAQAVGYIQAAPISADAVHFESELISNTKELAGAGDAALGNINPEQASGAAITAVQDQADIPLNREISSFTQMVENIAVLWYHLIAAYNPLGVEAAGGKVTREELERLCPQVKIDISSTIPNTVTARVNTLYSLLSGGMISFEEFMELVGSESNIPIAKLKALREQKAAEDAEAENAMMEQEAQGLESEALSAQTEAAVPGGEEVLESMFGG